MKATSIHKDTDQQPLLRQIAQGDAKAFKVLFDRYFDVVFSTALRYTVVRQHAEDAAQQVFMKLWEKREGLGEIQHLEGYLFTAAKREILQHFRRQSVRLDYIQHVIEVFGDLQELRDPEEVLLVKESEQIYQDLLSRLSPRQQEAFRLSREKGLTYAQIAEEMKISRDTVKEYIGQALKFIRDYVQQHPELLVMLPVLLLF